MSLQGSVDFLQIAGACTPFLSRWHTIFLILLLSAGGHKSARERRGRVPWIAHSRRASLPPRGFLERADALEFDHRLVSRGVFGEGWLDVHGGARQSRRLRGLPRGMQRATQHRRRHGRGQKRDGKIVWGRRNTASGETERAPGMRILARTTREGTTTTKWDRGTQRRRGWERFRERHPGQRLTSRPRAIDVGPRTPRRDSFQFLDQTGWGDENE